MRYHPENQATVTLKYRESENLVFYFLVINCYSDIVV